MKRGDRSAPCGSISFSKDVETPAQHRSVSTSDGMPQLPPTEPCVPRLAGTSGKTSAFNATSGGTLIRLD
ncbi:hypothetical protein B0H19DRAFT_1097281 [Mycena capillaripes]|nr:hypothetical protein B0H19DRAFT_1097184 [Mycena capillaripes]KAJ6594958.1 hypothetical protein B0H19DRAFT_1097281 [Mycena capillaripes]